MPPSTIENNRNFLLTIDVEEWFQVENLRANFPPATWERQASRVESTTHLLLDMLDSFSRKIRATFYILGWVAERHPGLVREISRRGHEIASHGCRHLLNYDMKPDELFEDLRRSKMLLEDIAGEPVHGYRAPSFSIDEEVLGLIRAAGYLYDSSYNSFERNGRYGKIETRGRQSLGIAFEIRDGFFELPVSNLSFAGRILPWGGGGYFRLIPPALFHSGVNRILRRQDAYLMYLHPWEIDPEQPRPERVAILPAFRHYLNLDKTFLRLRNVIDRFRTCQFTTCYHYLNTLKEVAPGQRRPAWAVTDFN